MKRILFFLLIIIIAGCCKKIYFPPPVQLNEYQPIGIIDFTSNAEGDIDILTKNKFMQYMRHEQKSIALLELGSKDKLLLLINMNELNAKAIKLIGEKYNVKTIITGEINVSDIKPNISFSTTPYLGVKAEIILTLDCKMYDTQSGANIWTQSAYIKDNVASIDIIGSNIYFNADNPERAYGKLIEKLVWYITKDFRHYYKCK